MGCGFSPKSRLTDKESFSKVFAQPLYVKKTHLFAVFAIAGPTPQARLGIVVAKRNIKLAVARNRVKRLIRESFRLHQAQLSGLDVVVLVKRNFDTVPDLFQGVGDKHSRCYKG